jgi:methionyl-tRNA formyltransferase
VDQDDQLSCYAAKITKQEALIDWSQPAQVLDRQVRAFNPFPAAYTTLGELRIKVWQAEVAATEVNIPPCQIISADNAGLLVSCGEQSLLITEIQLPGKSRMAVSEILKSRGELFAPRTLLGS